MITDDGRNDHFKGEERQRGRKAIKNTHINTKSNKMKFWICYKDVKITIKLYFSYKQTKHNQ